MTSRRFFSDYYDSVGQRSLFSGEQNDEGAESARKLYLARLRFDTLLSERLILTDSQLLDGRFFLGGDPKALMDAMSTMAARQIPIEIRARAGDLEQALIGFVRSDGAYTLHGFSFSAIHSADERREVAHRLQHCPADAVKGIADMVQLLREAGVAADNVEALDAGWRRWVELSRSGGLTVVQWGRRDLDNFRTSRDRALNRLRLGVERGPYTPAERAALLALIEGFKADTDENGVKITRSHLDIKHRVFGDAHQDPKMRKAADRVRDIYNSCYHASFAEQHECDVHEVGGNNSLDGPSAVSDSAHVAVGEFDDLPPSVIQFLGKMESDQYTNLVVSNSLGLTEWWRRGNKKALRDVIDNVLGRSKIFEPDDPALAKWANKVWPLVVKGVGGTVGAAATIFLETHGVDRLPATAAGRFAGAVVETALPARLRFLSSEGKTMQRVMDVAKERRQREKGH